MSTPDWIDDYHALVEGSGVARLEGWSSLVVAGADAATLLNNFCTNDIPKLEVGAACEAFFPNAKGKVLAFGWVWRTESEVYHIVLGSPRWIELKDHLDRYVIREDVKLRVEDAVLAITLSSTAADAESTIVTAFDGNTRFVFNPPSNLTPVASEAFDAYRVERGVPLDFVDVNDSNLPQELGRDDSAISFTKGCYLGQETVARIDALGHVNQTLVLLKVEGEGRPSPDDALLVEDKAVGRVTSVSWSPQHEATVALAYVRRGNTTAGAVLGWTGGVAVVLGD